MYKSLICIISLLSIFNTFHFIYISHSQNEVSPPTLRPLQPITNVVVTVNGGFLDFFSNWKHYANEAGIEDSDIIVIAEDELAYESLMTEYPLLKIESSSYGMTPDAHIYNSKQYIKMVSKRPNYLLSLLKSSDNNILYMDIDTVLLGDIRKLYNDDDVMVLGIDATNVMGVENYYCTGIMYFKNCPDSIKTLTEWDNRIQKKHQLNQPLFNNVVRSLDVQHRPFDKYAVMSGNTVKQNGILGNTVLVHANYIQGHTTKVNFLASYGLWYPKINIAICTCVRSRKGDAMVNKLDIYKYLIKSIQKTVTDIEKQKYNVKIYVYFDDDDDFWIKNHTFDWLNVTEFPVKMYMTPHTDRIPWNEVTRKAYDEGADYFFRTNDDVELKSKGWIDLAVGKLKDMNNVGVVGPKSLKGNTNILTLDFTHRTHMEIFDTYYPQEFKNWYVDDFITYVYNERLQILPEWNALHLVKATRYSVYSPSKKLYSELMADGKMSINNYLNENKVPLIFATNAKNIPCAVSHNKPPEKTSYFDYWIECNNKKPPPDICDKINTHVLPSKSNGFLLEITTYGGCKITPRNVYNLKARGFSRRKHIQTQTTY